MTTSSSAPRDRGLDPMQSAFTGERRRLTDLAYRMLGSVAEAEDVVQETYARWYAMSQRQQEAVASPGGWLTKVAGRICLDVLRSARVRRERYVGAWVPDPLPARTEWSTGAMDDSTADPADRITLDESVSMAFLVVLETMTPAERVAFVLHDVFRYPFSEVADIVGRTPAACRQLASSARRRVEATRAPLSPTAQRARVVRDFKLAWEAKDINALIGLLDTDATAVGDSGGLVSARLHPIEGAEHIARFFADRTLPGRLAIRECTVNGQPGLAAHLDGAALSVYAFDIADGRIRRIWAVLNPAKLRPWKTD
ncbi:MULTISPECIES: RNA polymerase sigma factor SigJ [unclassified Streptomyces]|uniref:RNA polymerase sigma factor SigJ n=1 Tax=unclassified Streptomyces TaxID=2593676 RepID=UPI002965F3DC|nr:RNA polymerase sigma factor SigJ [Streptomyces sp. SJL17-1]